MNSKSKVSSLLCLQLCIVHMPRQDSREASITLTGHCVWLPAQATHSSTWAVLLGLPAPGSFHGVQRPISNKIFIQPCQLPRSSQTFLKSYSKVRDRTQGFQYCLASSTARCSYQWVALYCLAHQVAPCGTLPCFWLYSLELPIPFYSYPHL